MIVFEGRTADAAWMKAAKEMRSDASLPLQPSRAGDIRELLHVVSVVAEPRERWILSRQPAINPAFAIAEVVWILAGRDDAAFLNFWNPALPKFAGGGATYHGAYGERLRRNLGIDQIDRAFRALDSAPESRQVVLQIWDGRRDLPGTDGTPASPDIPCNIVSLLKIRGGALEWVQVMRSNDLILGLPHNAVQFTSLQEIMAGWLGVEQGVYHHFSDSLHVYDRNVPDLEASAEIEIPANTDRLALPRDEFEPVFAELEGRFDELRGDGLAEAGFREILGRDDLPEAYLNLLRIAAADAARRRGWTESVDAAAEACTNPALSLAWERWAERQRERAGRAGGTPSTRG